MNIIDISSVRELTRQYYETIESLSSLLNISVKESEILLFIHNYTRVHNYNTNKSTIELHLNYKDVKSQLLRLRELNLIRLSTKKKYVVTDTAPLQDMNDLSDYVVLLHNLDNLTVSDFFLIMRFVHCFESMIGLETPISMRRKLSRCYVMCDTFSLDNIKTVIRHTQTQCVFLRDLRKIDNIIEEVFLKDTFESHVSEIERQNREHRHNINQFQKAKAYVLDYNNLSDFFRKFLDKETYEIAEDVRQQRESCTEDEIIRYLYRQIVLKPLYESALQTHRDCVYYVCQTE